MPVLEISQIIFNIVISFAVVVVTVLVSVIAYDIIKLKKSIKEFLENILNLSFIAKFFKRKKK